MLLVRALAGFVFLFAVVATAFFGAAGSIRHGRAWLALAVFFGCAAAITLWLWRRDQALLDRRVRAGPGSEPDPVQNLIQAVAGVAFLALFVVAGLDRRFGGSAVPDAISWAGDGLIATGFLVVFLTFRANTYTAGVIEIAEGQRLVDTGPYRFVRHPMYAGALILIFGVPPALGSWWGLVPAGLLAPLIAWRLAREEAFLTGNLAGYGAYRGRVRHRLVPGIW